MEGDGWQKWLLILSEMGKCGGQKDINDSMWIHVCDASSTGDMFQGDRDMMIPLLVCFDSHTGPMSGCCFIPSVATSVWSAGLVAADSTVQYSHWMAKGDVAYKKCKRTFQKMQKVGKTGLSLRKTVVSTGREGKVR